MFMNEFFIIYILFENSIVVIFSFIKICQVFNGSQDIVGENVINRSFKFRKSKIVGSFGFDDDVEKEEDSVESFQSFYLFCWQYFIDNSICDVCQDNIVKLVVLFYVLVIVKFEIYIQ